MDTPDPDFPLALDVEHARTCHYRWILRRNNLKEGEDYNSLPDEWAQQQCGECLYYVPLRGAGAFSSDWGVCSNAESPFDGRAMFEHDGCSHYEGASSWITDHPAFVATDGIGD